ncbi:hypothetical protein O6H91_05G081000 [Diphasiastrum complanatum]|uniref:Uncharacterized protein n=2 Tax=Diphasiastrum complanatum TaxID=34168 RepID=A0ACC2DQ20_DIPCM|nr:hypothetical protein O6H91_05G080800 [Diphasiastrum complanatum]KAJ7556394.1 hypothetical protein O6H91_05G081000 [Diphasiastrum complanatum]
MMERFLVLVLILLSSVSGEATTKAPSLQSEDCLHPYSAGSPNYESSTQLDAAGNRLNTTQPRAVPASDLQYKFVNETRRKLGQFSACGPCKCCANQNKQDCFLTACCYRINCSIKNLPYGLCLFVPAACHCFGCS